MKLGLKILIVLAVSPLFLYGTWLIARMLVFDYFNIPTLSMSPTLLPGDKVIVNKLIVGARIYTDLDFDLNGQELKSFRQKGRRRICHNDIVVFNMANHNGKLNFIINNVYCKRVIGLPGDSVGAIEGHYYNNNYDGELGIGLEQDHLAQIPDSMITWGFWLPPHHDSGWNLKNFGPLYIPRKGDVLGITAKEAVLYQLLLEWELNKSITWDWEKNTAFADGKPLKRHRFCHDYYFMAGDNAKNSSDSRYWGLVPEEYVVGVVDKVIRNNKIFNPNERN